MLISENNLRNLVKELILEFEIEKITSGDANLIDTDNSENNFVLGDYQYEFIGSGNYVMPAPIFNNTDYSAKITSPPQEKRTDVGDVTNKATGVTKKRGASSHLGYDFGTPTGTPIVAFFDGTVASINISASNSGGKYVYLSHSDSSIKSTGYLHLSKILVKKGDKIKAGQVVGLSGATGNITGPHLHFGVKKAGESKSSHDKAFYDSLFANSKKVKITKISESGSSDAGSAGVAANAGNDESSPKSTPKDPGETNKSSNKLNLPSGQPGSDFTKNKW